MATKTVPISGNKQPLLYQYLINNNNNDNDNNNNNNKNNKNKNKASVIPIILVPYKGSSSLCLLHHELGVVMVDLSS